MTGFKPRISLVLKATNLSILCSYFGIGRGLEFKLSKFETK